MKQKFFSRALLNFVGAIMIVFSLVLIIRDQDFVMGFINLALAATVIFPALAKSDSP